MKRAGILLLLALVLLGGLVAPAQAAQPAKAKAVDQSRAAVVKYWTAERMRNAIPLDIVEAPIASGSRGWRSRSPATSRRPTTPRTGRCSSPTAPPTTCAPAPR
jgi:hypothetical protein